MTHWYEEEMRRKKRERLGRSIFAMLVLGTAAVVTIAALLLILEAR